MSFQGALLNGVLPLRFWKKRPLCRRRLQVDFLKGSEGVAENAQQLFALCKDAGINHLIYAGFTINWCLLLSPGGMADMSKHGIMCSALRQAVTAVENKETARGQLNKESGLWRVALAFGFMFDVPDFIGALQS